MPVSPRVKREIIGIDFREPKMSDTWTFSTPSNPNRSPSDLTRIQQESLEQRTISEGPTVPLTHENLIRLENQLSRHNECLDYGKELSEILYHPTSPDQSNPSMSSPTPESEKLVYPTAAELQAHEDARCSGPQPTLRHTPVYQAPEQMLQQIAQHQVPTGLEVNIPLMTEHTTMGTPRSSTGMSSHLSSTAESTGLPKIEDTPETKSENTLVFMIKKEEEDIQYMDQRLQIDQSYSGQTSHLPNEGVPDIIPDPEPEYEASPPYEEPQRVPKITCKMRLYIMDSLDDQHPIHLDITTTCQVTYPETEIQPGNEGPSEDITMEENKGIQDPPITPVSSQTLSEAELCSSLAVQIATPEPPAIPFLDRSYSSSPLSYIVRSGK